MDSIKSILISFLVILFGAASQTDSAIQSQKESLLSQTEGTFSVYIIADEEVAQDYSDEVFALRNVSTVRVQTTLEGVIYEDVSEIPTFNVYDTEDKVFETTEYKALLEFLNDN